MVQLLAINHLFHIVIITYIIHPFSQRYDPVVFFEYIW